MVKDVSLLAPIFQKAKSFALFCHSQPDGDTVGSAMGLAFALRKIGKTVNVFCEDKLSDRILEYVPQTEVLTEMTTARYDAFVAVDCGDISRLGLFATPFERHQNTVVIDHHMGKPYGKSCYIGDFSSTAEIIFNLIKALKIELDDNIAKMLYIGLITDTGNFMHANTNQNTFATATALSKYQIKIPELCRVFFRDTSLQRAKLIGRVLTRVRSYYDDRFCLIYVLKNDLNELGLEVDSAKNIVDYAINIKTALVGVSLVEASENVFRISLRGKEFDVRSIAERFGGGGHKFASGCQINGFFEDAVDTLVRYVGEKFEEEKLL